MWYFYVLQTYPDILVYNILLKNKNRWLPELFCRLSDKIPSHSQSQKFLFRKEIYIEHQNILTAIQYMIKTYVLT